MEGLKVPRKQPKRRRLWLNDGSCIRLRPRHKDHVWSYDFVMAWTANGKAFRILVIIDEYTRECLAMLVARHITSGDVLPPIRAGWWNHLSVRSAVAITLDRLVGELGRNDSPELANKRSKH